MEQELTRTEQIYNVLARVLPHANLQYLEIVAEMAVLHNDKNHDYSADKEGFGNFQESEKVGVPAWKGAFIRMQDKYTRCCNIIGGKEALVNDEGIDQTLIDLGNYAIIVQALRRQAKATKIGGPQVPLSEMLDRAFRTPSTQQVVPPNGARTLRRANFDNKEGSPDEVS